MDKNTSKKNANRLVYITVVVIICVMTVLIGVTSALNRRENPAATSSSTSLTTQTPTTLRTTRPTSTPSLSSPTSTSTPSAALDPSSEQVDNMSGALPEFIMPTVGNISKDYDLTTLVYSLTMNDYRVHTGIDIAGAIGDAVYCAADGVVEQVWTDPLMGQCVSVRHSGDAMTYYKNLSPELSESIASGYRIKSGEVIGCIGESAIIEIADEPHLHFEMKVGSLYADPLDYLPASAVSAMIETDFNYED